MPHFLRRIASSFTRNPEMNQLKTPIFDTPLTDQTVEDLEMLQREILTQYNKAIDQKETAKQNHCPAAARLAHHQARSQRLKLNLVKQKLYQRLPLIAKPSEQRNMSFIDTPAASSSSTPDHSHMRGKRPAVPSHAQTLSTFKALDLFADDETAQKICSYFEDPDTVLALNELAKVSRAHQQEEREICLARHQSCVRQTMATVLLDKLQSWGLEREIEDMLWKHRRESPTVQKLSIFPLTSFHLQNTIPSRPLPARPPAYRRAVRFSPVIDNSPSPQISPPTSTPSRSPIPTPTPQRSPKTATHQRSSSTTSSSTTNCSMSATSVTCFQCGEPGHICPRCPKFKCIYCYRYAPRHSFRDCSYNPENERHTDPYYGGIDEDLLNDARIANTTGEPYGDY
ncbi:hypothetical protein CVT25_005297 [Psilocybe cyanescens]|uniref:CCHC-type domain-containing protein n=1 Tax=Psilocybe cyanescens TaxID=93625 RepID=A0A409XRW2_PSICY|nr:hypothetical protein CVT25_005297 [Psilocybe cyanescens]